MFNEMKGTFHNSLKITSEARTFLRLSSTISIDGDKSKHDDLSNILTSQYEGKSI